MSRPSGSATTWRAARAETRSVVRLIAVFAWLLTLGVAFFLHRGNDAGQLPAILRRAVGTIASGPVLGATGLITSAAGLLIAALIVLAWFGLGDLVLRRPDRGLLEDTPPALALSCRCLSGAVLWSTAWMGLGILPLYRGWVAVTALIVGIALAGLASRRFAAPPAIAPEWSAAGRVAIVLTGTVMILALIGSLAPPTARDALFYHFSLPKAYIEAGRGALVPYNMATFYPQAVEMQVVWAMLLGRFAGQQAAEAAAGATVFAFAPLLALVTYGWSRDRKIEPVWAAVAVVMMMSIPTVYDIAGSGYVDLALAAYTALAVHAVGRWWTTLDARWITPLALGVAGALSIKLIAGFLALSLALTVLVRAAQIPRAEAARRLRALATGIGALALGGLIAAPWYARTWIRTGSPVFPFYLNIWPGEAAGWDLARSRLYQSLLSSYGDAQSAIDYILTPIRLAVSAQPDQTACYDGVLGIAFLFALPILMWALARARLDVELRIAAAVSTVMFLFWLFSSQQIRLLLPALPGFAVAMAAAGMRGEGALRTRLLRWLFIVAAGASVPVVLAWFATLDPVRVVLGGEPRATYLARRLDYYPYYQVINAQLGATARVWLINMRRDTYHIDRPYFSDFVFEDYTLEQYVRDAHSAADVRARARKAGITHLLIRHDVLLDYATSPIVDDRQLREHNLAKMEILKRFLGEGTRLIRGDTKFWLIELGPSTQ